MFDLMSEFLLYNLIKHIPDTISIFKSVSYIIYYFKTYYYYLTFFYFPMNPIFLAFFKF